MYYFAYGSNMNWQQMQQRCPSAKFVCVARLPGYRFAITRHSRLRRCGTANVLADAGGEVWGIVYNIDGPAMTLLDSFEDGYRRKRLRVEPADGREPIHAVVYVAENEADTPPPNAEYIRLILEGATHWKIPPLYIAMLQTIRSGT